MPSDNSRLNALIVQTGLGKYERYRVSGDAVVREVYSALVDSGIVNAEMIETAYLDVAKAVRDAFEDHSNEFPFEVRPQFFQFKQFLNDDEVLMAGDVDEPREEVNTSLSLSDIDPDKARKGAAIRKSKAVNAAKCMDDYWSEEHDYPNVDLLIVLHDGTNRGIEAVLNGRGVNQFLSSDGVPMTIDVSVEDAVLKTRHAVDTEIITPEDADTLTDGQIEELTDEQMVDLGIEAEAAEAPAD